MNVTRFMLATAAALVFVPRASAHAQTLTLGEAIDAALASHPSLRAAELRVDAADARIGIARAQLLPSAFSSTTLTTFEEPMIVAPLHRLDPANLPVFDRTLLQGQVGVQYTLFDGGARRAFIQTSEAVGEIARERLASAGADLLTDVTAAYLAVLSAREVRAAALRQVASLESERRRADQSFDEGTVARVDILRAEAALQSARAEEVSAETRVGLAERSLARAMGVAPAALVGRGFADVAWVSDTPVATGAQRAATDAIEPRSTDPRITAAQHAVDAARQRVAQERASRLPTVRGNAALLGFASGEWDPSTEWQAGVSVSWPVFTGGARGATIRQAEADLAVEEEMLRTTELVVATELDQADAAILEAQARTEALAAAVTQWEEVARIEALSLSEGAGVQHDFLRAEASLFQARAALSRARYDEVLGHVRLARAQGALDRTWITAALEAGR